MGDYDDAVQELREQGLDDVAAVFEKYSASALRKKASERDEMERKLQDAERRLERFAKAPKREQAFAQAGVNFDELRPAEREVLNSLDWDGEEPTDEWVAAQIEKYGFPTNPVETESEEEPGAAAVVQAATSAPRAPGRTTLSPEDVAEWDTERLLRLREKNPDAYEALKRGETVTGVAF